MSAPDWIDKAIQDMPPLTDEECAGLARILDDLRLELAREAIAKKNTDE